MTEIHAATVHAIGVDVRCEFTGAYAESAVRAATEAWSGLVAADGNEGGEARRLQFEVDAIEALPSILDSMSTQVTLEGIEQRSGEFLLLHACGLRLPGTNRVAACVAPSGTGKTTLARTAAGSFEYVTDETVAVARDGRIVPYPKPLSVKDSILPHAPKSQRAPESFGLKTASPDGRDRELRLSGIVLIARAPEHVEPSIEIVELFSAIMQLVPELSYLSRMDAPLHRIAEAVLRTGGVLRLRYAEAQDAIRLLKSDAGPFGREPAEWDAGARLTRLLDSDAELAGLRSEVRAAIDGRPPGAAHALPPSCAVEGSLGISRDRLHAAKPLDDVLLDAESGTALVFVGGRVLQLSLLGLVVLLAAESPISQGQLEQVVVELLGEPERGVAGAILDQAIDVLNVNGALQFVAEL